MTGPGIRLASMLLAAWLATPAALAQPLSPELLAAFGVGRAHAMLMQAAPCPAAGQIEAMLHASLDRIMQDPDALEAYQRGMTMTRNAQRYIPRSDPYACAEIGRALQAHLQMQAR